MVTSGRLRKLSAAVLAVLAVVLAACSSGHTAGHANAVPYSADPGAPTGPVSLEGWKLTVPDENDDGNAATVDPAALTAPWLGVNQDGGLEFWAPSVGATTKNSDHPRTELVSLSNFSAGRGNHVLTGSFTALQVPDDGQGIIVAQIHGAGDISSVPFVMLRYQDEQLKVIVKTVQDGDAHLTYPLLPTVPLGARVAFTITDPGTGSMAFSATSNGDTQQATAPIPAAFTGATVRFQAGDYQQADQPGGTQDGGRLVFQQLVQQPS